VSAAHLELLLRILTLAAQLGRAIDPAAVPGLLRSVFDGSLSADTAALKAAAAVSLSLDVALLAADLSAFYGLLLAADAAAAMDHAVDFTRADTDRVPLLSPANEARFAELERAATEPPRE